MRINHRRSAVPWPPLLGRVWVQGLTSASVAAGTDGADIIVEIAARSETLGLLTHDAAIVVQRAWCCVVVETLHTGYARCGAGAATGNVTSLTLLRVG